VGQARIVEDSMKSVEILKELIKIPSLNPEDTDRTEWVGEQGVVDWVESYLTPLGFKCERREMQPGRPNLIARLAGPQATRSLCLEVHADTVAVDTMVIPPFEPTEREGRIYGRGACDDKGPMAAALAAMDETLVAAVLGSELELMIVISTGEEKSCLGAQQLADEGFRADQCIVLEPTALVPVIAHKGPFWVAVEVQGIAGHGSKPEKGLNAIEGMMAFISRLKAWETQRASAFQDELLGGPTINIGQIEGGMAPNIIPDRCRIVLDRRNMPDEMPEEIVEVWSELLEALKAEGLIAGYHVEPQVTGKAFHTSAASPLVEDLNISVAKYVQAKAPVGTGWFSDAGPLSAGCVEILVWGPGNIAQAHTKDEWISVEQLELGENILKDFIVGSCGMKE